MKGKVTVEWLGSFSVVGEENRVEKRVNSR